MQLIGLRAPAGPLQGGAALLLALAMAATVGGALLFQHAGGYLPCALCLEQRTPYYLAVPVALAALVCALARLPGWTTRALLALAGALMAWAFALGAFHAGVEWRWWAGPADCAAAGGGLALGSGSLLESMDAVRPPSCADAALRILGLSLAGWNALIAFALAALALAAAFGPARRR